MAFAVLALAQTTALLLSRITSKVEFFVPDILNSSQSLLEQGPLSYEAPCVEDSARDAECGIPWHVVHAHLFVSPAGARLADEGEAQMLFGRIQLVTNHLDLANRVSQFLTITCEDLCTTKWDYFQLRLLRACR
jgi:hypothetical protein